MKTHWVKYGLMALLIGILGGVLIPDFSSRGPHTTPANACINKLRQIDGAKEEWVLEHPGHTNDVVTLDDLNPYLKIAINASIFKLDRHGQLLGCPLGGIYTIGKIGEPPTCSLGTNVTPAHVLQ